MLLIPPYSEHRIFTSVYVFLNLIVSMKLVSCFLIMLTTTVVTIPLIYFDHSEGVLEKC